MTKEQEIEMDKILVEQFEEMEYGRLFIENEAMERMIGE